MHMADALISPAVGATMWAATGVTTVYCAKKVREELDESKIPLMGVAGAFIFAAQMLNFTIPGTGSSGHLGGALILAILLGPEAAFLVMASVLGVQALFFADGGLLALGANIFNLGFFPAFVAYPLVYRRIVGAAPTNTRIVAGSIAAAIVGLQLGALGVVLETTLSGVSELPFQAFAALVLPIHLAIGLVEGVVTAAVILFVQEAQPELLSRTAAGSSLRGLNLGPVLIGFAAAALVSASALAWFASSNPDGLEWSIQKVAGSTAIEGAATGLHDSLAEVQERVALMPGYGFRDDAGKAAESDVGEPGFDVSRIDSGTSVSGAVGAVLVLAVAAGVGVALRRRSARRTSRVT